MDKKVCELRYVEALKRSLPDFPTGDLEASETPDFLVRSGGRTTGIEVTVFHLPSTGSERPHQEQQALKDRIVERAWTAHVEAKRAALYVSVFFRSVPLNRSEVDRIAGAVEAAVSNVADNVRHEGETVVPWSLLPPEVAHISIHRSVDGHDQLWHADHGGWVAQVSSSQVETVVQRKARTALRAREKCDQLWLLIVNDQFSRAAQAELSAEASDATYRHPFDRLLWLVPHRQSVVVLRQHALDTEAASEALG